MPKTTHYSLQVEEAALTELQSGMYIPQTVRVASLPQKFLGDGRL